MATSKLNAGAPSFSPSKPMVAVGHIERPQPTTTAPSARSINGDIDIASATAAFAVHPSINRDLDITDLRTVGCHVTRQSRSYSNPMPQVSSVFAFTPRDLELVNVAATSQTQEPYDRATGLRLSNASSASTSGNPTMAPSHGHVYAKSTDSSPIGAIGMGLRASAAIASASLNDELPPKLPLTKPQWWTLQASALRLLSWRAWHLASTNRHCWSLKEEYELLAAMADLNASGLEVFGEIVDGLDGVGGCQEDDETEGDEARLREDFQGRLARLRREQSEVLERMRLIQDEALAAAASSLEVDADADADAKDPFHVQIREATELLGMQSPTWSVTQSFDSVTQSSVTQSCDSAAADEMVYDADVSGLSLSASGGNGLAVPCAGHEGKAVSAPASDGDSEDDKHEKEGDEGDDVEWVSSTVHCAVVKHVRRRSRSMN
jgi:hypothetical protein